MARSHWAPAILVCSASSSSIVFACPSSLTAFDCWSSALRIATSCWFCSFSALCRETFMRSAAVLRPARYRSRNSACGWVIALSSVGGTNVPPLLHPVVVFRLEKNIRRFRTAADKKNQIACRSTIDGKHRPPLRLPQAQEGRAARRARSRGAVLLHALRLGRVPSLRPGHGPLRSL